MGDCEMIIEYICDRCGAMLSTDCKVTKKCGFCKRGELKIKTHEGEEVKESGH